MFNSRAFSEDLNIHIVGIWSQICSCDGVDAVIYGYNHLHESSIKVAEEQQSCSTFTDDIVEIKNTYEKRLQGDFPLCINMKRDAEEPTLKKRHHQKDHIMPVYKV